ncbi:MULTISPECIES: NUDIX hydrolase [Streptomyces]|uniref:NUDIX hydrolase n=1 Tax=Streptomyces solicathayae TaxID=3081768 RepID=A0ABZ0LVI2_9ACTN|nr:NUDIX hydrolase [Streptomyces sp. HUAS YS2]WOX23516.1 NUDIX hydrolase [Streptomyces sp. HUAS YS2]
MTSAPTPILAAGCVLWRPALAGGGIEIALVFRPKWSDWSHPKGKLKRGEKAEDGARREVREETGMTCDLGIELPTVHYAVEGRPKEVRYWAAEVAGGSFEPNREVSRLLWLSPEAARARLTQQRDKELVDAFLKAWNEPPPGATLA